LGQSDEVAFGLDKSDVTVEQIPLVCQPVTNIELKREDNMHTMFNHLNAPIHH
jgi:KUP system potassium uptake protein